jgi:hypothetical protein
MHVSINWREKLIAASIHFLVTVTVAAIAAAGIFTVWFPDAFAAMVGGTKLFLIVLAVDLALGPLISLVIYSSKKSRRELMIDYVVVGTVQLAALLYGVFAVAVSRPVFIVFHGERLEVVTAVQLTDEDLEQGIAPEFRSRSWLGPRLVGVELPTHAKERADLLFSAVAGKDAELMPKYYRLYETAHRLIDERSRPLDTLRAADEAKQSALDAAIASSGVPREQLRWLPMRHRFGFAVALIDIRTRQPVDYLAIAPKL